MSHDHPHHDGHALRLAFIVTLLFSGVEAAGGWWSGSLALLSDAGHMLSDALALGLAAFASWLARRPPSARHSYGLLRAEVIAALLNCLLMLGLIVGIVVEAIRRLQAPSPVSGLAVMAIAAAGLGVNIFLAFMLARGEGGLNTRAALLHVMGDLLGSVAALVAGAAIHFTGWLPIDPILSLAVALLILASTVRLLREALHILMEGVPTGIVLAQVGKTLAAVPGVRAVHDLHVWTLSSGRVALSAHLELEGLETWMPVLENARRQMRDRFDISHVTLQPEVPAPAPQGERRHIPIHPDSHSHDHFHD